MDSTNHWPSEREMQRAQASREELVERLTGGAGVDMTAKRLGSTLGNRLHHLQLAWGQRAAKASAIGRPVAAEDLAKRGHRMPAESVSSTPLANSCAFWVRCV
jgi:hypothetical protein